MKKIIRLPISPRPALKIARWTRGQSLWHDSEALTFLEHRLRSEQYDRAVLTGWKSLDLFGSVDRRAAAFRQAILDALESGRRISIAIGGILSPEDLNSLLLEMRRVLSNRRLRYHFDKGRLKFARDSAQRPLHAKCWVFWMDGKIVDLAIGSFNLSTIAFFRNIEAAARIPADEADSLVEKIEQVLTQGAIPPKKFGSVEKCLQSRRPETSEPAEKRELPYLDLFEKKQRTSQARPQKLTTPVVQEPKLSDYFVVLRDPSRGERVGYRIPEDLLADLFGKDFLGTKETEMGFIQGPKSQIVPFPVHLAKEYRSRMGALSSEIAARCTPTSVGYVVREDLKDDLRDRLEKKFAANQQTKRNMEQFIEDQEFRDFLMKQIETQIIALRDRYAKQVKLRKESLAKKLRSRRSTILRLAKQAAKQMIERLDSERTVSFVPLDDLLDLTEGISRTEIEAELGER